MHNKELRLPPLLQEQNEANRESTTSGIDTNARNHSNKTSNQA